MGNRFKKDYILDRMDMINKITEQQYLPAGDFSSWLRHARNELFEENGTDVACGECISCCCSSYFIHIKPAETRTLGRISKDILFSAPWQPEGDLLMGYDVNGRCPMLMNGRCSIYGYRPQTCRDYDCRVFAAAGIAAGGKDKAEINRRIMRWEFSYPTDLDRREHLAVKAAAAFIQKHPDSFPGGRAPSNPSQLAILAIKVYEVFLEKDGGATETGSASVNASIAGAIVDACREFDARAGWNFS
jgi:uncharacterized protein